MENSFEYEIASIRCGIDDLKRKIASAEAFLGTTADLADYVGIVHGIISSGIHMYNVEVGQVLTRMARRLKEADRDDE